MKSSQPASDDHNQPTVQPVVLLLGTMADTTWRMFVPTVGFILLGFWADTSWQTKPWLTFVGLVIGSLITAGLIKQQFKRVKADTKK